VRRELVLAPVPRQERHPDPAHVADRDGCRRRAVRRVDGELLDRLHERVEARPTEHADGRGAQLDSFDDFDGDEEEEPPVLAGCFDDEPVEESDDEPSELDDDVVDFLDSDDEDEPSPEDFFERLSVL
jgi:hypothetical protein